MTSDVRFSPPRPDIHRSPRTTLRECPSPSRRRISTYRGRCRAERLRKLPHTIFAADCARLDCRIDGLRGFMSNRTPALAGQWYLDLDRLLNSSWRPAGIRPRLQCGDRRGETCRFRVTTRPAF
jgi:hypothetical protein